MDFEEFEAVITALHHTGVGDADSSYIWQVMNPSQLPEITFEDFVAGISAVQADESLSNLDLAAANNWSLLSLVIDTPVSKGEEKQLLRSYGFAVRLGMLSLKHTAVPLDKTQIAAVMSDARNGQLHVLDKDKDRQLRSLRRRLAWRSFCIGALSGLFTAGWEICLIFILGSNGVFDPNSGESSDRSVLFQWWVFNIIFKSIRIQNRL